MTGIAAAEPDDSGYDPDVWHEFEDGYPSVPCTVYFYGDVLSEVSRFIGLGYDVTVGYDLSYANISEYDVLVIPWVGPGQIGGTQAAIEQYVGEGGGLFIHQAGATTTGMLDYAPAGFDFYITSVGYCYPFDVQTIVKPGHPTMAGLTWGDLPGRFDEIHIDDLGAGYTLIAEGAAGCEGDTHCAGGAYMDGLVFMDCSNLSAYSMDPGSDQYIINVVDWLCTGGGTAVESATWGAIKSHFK
jgi:hypothetical protein